MSRQVAIVTASGKGLGAATARELSAAGYSLALMSNSGGAVALAAELGAVGLNGSVTSEDDLQRLVDETLDTYGRIDAVVNNTGHPPKGPSTPTGGSTRSSTTPAIHPRDHCWSSPTTTGMPGSTWWS
jgi:NAD(P)-dependent dehydrogenase (short-subunit alcohol dehydrogenase family)